MVEWFQLEHREVRRVVGKGHLVPPFFHAQISFLRMVKIARELVKVFGFEIVNVEKGWHQKLWKRGGTKNRTQNNSGVRLPEPRAFRIPTFELFGFPRNQRSARINRRLRIKVEVA